MKWEMLIIRKYLRDINELILYCLFMTNDKHSMTE